MLYGTHRGYKRTSDPQELELSIVMYVLGTKLKSYKSKKYF